MCDQDHFEHDREEYERLGEVTHKQFGIMLGAGVAMMLPQVANALTVREFGRECANAGRDCRLLLRTSLKRHSARSSYVARRLARSGYSVLVVNPFYRTKKAHCGCGCRLAARALEQRHHAVHGMSESLPWVGG